MNDPYVTLGVAKNASQDDIKKSYRKLAKELHPDLNPNDSAVEQRFKEVSAAYHLLSDAETRAKFDRGEINADGSQAYESAFHRAHGGASGGPGGFDFEYRTGGRGGAGGGFDDIFADLFRNARSRPGQSGPQQAKGKDVTYTIRVSFEDAAKGTKRRIKLFDGKMLDVGVPAGTKDGQTLRLKGQGMRGLAGGPAGDALVTIHVDTHPLFTLDGNDIHLSAPVSLDEAVLGTKITVPTIDGKVSVTVPEGSSSGTKLRLKGKGLAPKGQTPGDQYVTLKVMLPEKPDSALKKFVKDWAKGAGDALRKKAGFGS